MTKEQNSVSQAILYILAHLAQAQEFCCYQHPAEKAKEQRDKLIKSLGFAKKFIEVEIKYLEGK